MRIAVLGDTHIPGRAERIPDGIVRELHRLNPARILFTGDACEYSVLFLLENIAPTYAVRGNSDRLDLPRSLSLELDGLRVFLIHGHQFGRGNYPALVEYAKGHDLLVCGHTHKQETFKEGGLVVINPGSATGARSGGGIEQDPSFTVIETGKMQVLEYRLGGENGIQVERAEIQDEEEV